MGKFSLGPQPVEVVAEQKADSLGLGFTGRRPLTARGNASVAQEQGGVVSVVGQAVIACAENVSVPDMGRV